MSGTSKPTETDEAWVPAGDVFDVAARWHGLVEDGELSPEARERFEAWLAADPAHRAAFESVEHAWGGMAEAGVHERILSMRREALAGAGKRRSDWRRYGAVAVFVAVTVAGAVGVGLRHGLPRNDPSSGEFATVVGQRSTITLADGSTVVLNTASRIQLAFNANARRVRLLEGQAWFEVAKNQIRPFVVEVGDRLVTAHGTAFDVRLEDRDQMQITLVEGRVSVESTRSAGGGPNVPAEREDLLPGEQLIVKPTLASVKRKGDVAKATSWREGQIIFDDDTLGSAVAEVNRYSVDKIVIGDPRLASLRLSGVFIAGHSASFLETVTGNFAIRATADSDGRIVLTAAH